MASIRPDNYTLSNKQGITGAEPSDIFDGTAVTDALNNLNDSLKALDGIIRAVEIPNSDAQLAEYQPDVNLAASDPTRLPVPGDFSTTPASDAVVVFDSLEFGPNDANTVYQNDYTIEVTVNEGEIFSVPFTAAPSNIDAIQQLELYITEGNPEFGVWWLSTQPGGLTLNQNAYTASRGLGGRISLESRLYYVNSITTMENNVSTYSRTGQMVPTEPYWLNFAYSTGDGIFGRDGNILPGIEVCPGTRGTTIYVQGDTIKYEAV